jgi:hypothetical protein
MPSIADLAPVVIDIEELAAPPPERVHRPAEPRGDAQSHRIAIDDPRDLARVAVRRRLCAVHLPFRRAHLDHGGVQRLPRAALRQPQDLAPLGRGRRRKPRHLQPPVVGEAFGHGAGARPHDPVDRPRIVAVKRQHLLDALLRRACRRRSAQRPDPQEGERRKDGQPRDGPQHRLSASSFSFISTSTLCNSSTSARSRRASLIEMTPSSIDW